MNRTPVFVLTGFLGAGKSTLLNRLLTDPSFAGTAVVINEFGDVALDHDLVHAGRAQVVRTTTGCLCCTDGSDLGTSLRELSALAGAGGLSFSRVVIETTGLADPAPLVNQLMRDPLVAQGFELAGIVALVDVVTGALSIENHFEAAKQIAFADRIVMTRTDLARDPASLRDIDDLRAQLAALNPAARLADANRPGFDLSALFRPRAYAPASLGDDVTGWLALDEAIRGEGHETREALPFSRHGGRIRTFSIVRERPVGREALRRFLDLLALSAGPRLLRVKGLVHDRDEPDRPRVLHVVQHAIFPLTALEAWPGAAPRPRLSPITDGIDPEPVRQLFEAALDGRPAGQGRALETLARTLRSGAARLARALTG
ncbi:MAG: GTP-binding protein [Aquamicrobium sp.]|uniref:CobW family GTP-binding protein n=1 Tax=Aquamicrobium sp. TaxID=1872579 RepID=UPI00349F009B|nr:GTP-binding protein [Aquamicrobium sp.]